MFNLKLAIICVNFLLLIPSNALARPSIIDIKQLELLYKLGVGETNELIRQAKIPIDINVNTGKYNITQMKNKSLQKITNSTQPNYECLKIYQSEVSNVSPNLLLHCDQSNTLNNAINKWGAVEAHIMFCTMSSTSTCVGEIKTEITQVKADNLRDIPEAARRAYPCRIAQTDFAAKAIDKAEKMFYECIGELLV